MNLPDYNQLSASDQHLVQQLWYIDVHLGYIGWPEISKLADLLENEPHKNFWKRICAHYNHLEEASAGDL